MLTRSRRSGHRRRAAARRARLQSCADLARVPSISGRGHDDPLRAAIGLAGGEPADAGWIAAARRRPAHDLRDRARRVLQAVRRRDRAEQIEHVLRGDGKTCPPYDIADEGIVVWPGNGYDCELVYDVRSKSLAPICAARVRCAMPDLDGRHALFVASRCSGRVGHRLATDRPQRAADAAAIVGPACSQAPRARRPGRGVARVGAWFTAVR